MILNKFTEWFLYLSESDAFSVAYVTLIWIVIFTTLYVTRNTAINNLKTFIVPLVALFTSLLLITGCYKSYKIRSELRSEVNMQLEEEGFVIIASKGALKPKTEVRLKNGEYIFETLLMDAEMSTVKKTKWVDYLSGSVTFETKEINQIQIETPSALNYQNMIQTVQDRSLDVYEVTKLEENRMELITTDNQNIVVEAKGDGS